MSGIPEDVMVLIRLGEEKRLAAEMETQRRVDEKRAKNGEVWEKWVEDVRNLLPDALKPWIEVKFELDREPHIYDEVRVVVPGLAPMRAMVKSPINRMEISSWEVACPEWLRNDEGEYDRVVFVFGGKAKSYQEVEYALLEGSLQADMAVELEKQLEDIQKRYKEYMENEYPHGDPVYEALDETVDDALVNALRGLIKAEIEKSL
jgi:hypothetical protein